MTIAVAGPFAAPLPRLLAALAERGHRAQPLDPAAGGEGLDERVILLGPGEAEPEVEALVRSSRRRGARILVLSLLGAHRDAGVEPLRRLWALEERARSLGGPVLTLRLGPLVGPRSPLWLRLRSGPRLPRGGRAMVQPVTEGDVIEILDRALSGAAPWRGWFELVGAEMMTLAELAAAARDSGPRLHAGAGSWEPPLAILQRQRPGEWRPWRDHFGIEPSPVAALARGWAP